MQRAFIVGLLVLAFVSAGVAYIALNQELLPTPDMAAPVGLLTFGFLGLVGGVAGYFWRYRP